MKVGIRKPNLKQRVSSITSGQLTRSAKRAFVPYYGKKEMGWLNPKKALYNRAYSMTTVSADDVGGCLWGIITIPFQIIISFAIAFSLLLGMIKLTIQYPKAERYCRRLSDYDCCNHECIGHFFRL